MGNERQTGQSNDASRISICPYCEELRDEAVKCCYNWGQILKIDKALGIKTEPIIPLF